MVVFVVILVLSRNSFSSSRISKCIFLNIVVLLGIFLLFLVNFIIYITNKKICKYKFSKFYYLNNLWKDIRVGLNNNLMNMLTIVYLLFIPFLLCFTLTAFMLYCLFFLFVFFTCTKPCADS